MRLLVLYASNSGNTMHTAELIAERLRKANYPVDLKNVTEVTPHAIANYDGYILGSCTWLTETAEGLQQGQLPKPFYDFAPKMRTDASFHGKPFAVFGLGRHEYTYFCAAVDHLEKLVADLGGHLVTESLRIDGFYQHNVSLIESWATDVARSFRQAAAPSSKVTEI